MEVKKEKQFIYYWYKELSWSSDPFKKGIPTPIELFIVGYEEERKKLNYFIIEKQKLCFIQSDDGMGKTSLIRWIKHELLSYQNLHVVSIDNSFDTKKLLNELVSPLLSFKERLLFTGSSFKVKKLLSMIDDPNLKNIVEVSIFDNIELDVNKLFSFIDSRMKNKHFVIIIDNLDEFSNDNFKIIQYLISNDLDAQMILTGNKKCFDKLNIQNKHINLSLNGLSYNSCLEMIKKRIEGCNGHDAEPFKEHDLKEIYKKSSGNPSLFLEYSRDKAIHLALNKIDFSGSAKNLKEIKEHIDEQANANDSKTDYEIKVISQPSHSIIANPVKHEKKIIEPVKVKKDSVNVKKIK